MQSALLHGAGQYSALAFYDLVSGKTAAEGRTAAARLISLAESGQLPATTRILVALGESMLEGVAAIAQVEDQALAANALEPGLKVEHAMLVQVAASCEEHRILALRVVDACVANVFAHKAEVLGGKILNQQEHFGFPDGEAPTGADMMDPLGHLGLRSNCEKAWFGWPCDAEVEKLRNTFATVSETGKRVEIAKAVQLRALETLPYVPLGQMYLVRAHSAKLSGILNAAIPVYWNIRKAP